jgi:hypothetical protein
MAPVLAPNGTVATISESLQLVIEAAVPDPPLNFTVLEPWVAPKPYPSIVTCVPTEPLDGENPVMIGLGVVK